MNRHWTKNWQSLQRSTRNLVRSLPQVFLLCMHVSVVHNDGDVTVTATTVPRPATSCEFVFTTVTVTKGGSVAERLACWTQAQKGPGSNRSRDAVG